MMFPKATTPRESLSLESSFGFSDFANEVNKPEKQFQSGPIQILEVSSILAGDASIAALKNNFPGPLSLGLHTSRSEVITFCDERAMATGLGSSSGILWRLLSLRVHHGGARRQGGALEGDNLV